MIVTWAPAGAMNETELNQLVTDGVDITRQGHLRAKSEEIERLKDAEYEKAENQKVTKL